MDLFGKLVSALHKNMDLRLEREALIGANLANVETPGYRPVDLKFDEELAQYMGAADEALTTTSAQHIGGPQPFGEVHGEVIEQAGETSADGNAVDLDRQMAELSSNSFNYRASARMINKKLGFLKYVINESR